MPLSTIVTNSISDANVTSAKIESTLSNKTLASPTVTGTAAFPDGSASAPSIFRAGDTNTGFFFPAADTVATSTGGSERMRIDSSGNVGIGTSSPGSFNAYGLPLVVGSGGGNQGLTIYSATTGYGGIHFADGTAGADSYRGIVYYQHSNDSMQFWTSATERMRIDSSGNVGIGTSSPASRLHVSGSFRQTGATVPFEWTVNAGASDFYKLNAVGYADNLLVANSSGRVGIGTTNPGARLDTAMPSSDYYSDGLVVKSTNADFSGNILHLTKSAGSVNSVNGYYLKIDDGTNTFLSVKGSGNVGIGTTSPGAKLHIYSSSGNGLRIDRDGSASTIEMYGAGGAGDYGGRFNIYRSGGTVASPTACAAGEYALVMSMYGYDGTQYIDSGGISVGITGTVSTNRVPTFISFSTHPDSTASSSERMRITSSGNVGIGTTSPSYQLQLSSDSAAKPSTNTWTVSSDERIKRNILPYEDGLAMLLRVEPVTYQYNGLGGFAESDDRHIGIIAQALQPVAPYMIASHKGKLNPENPDEEEIDLLDYNGHAMTFALVNAVKELHGIIQGLKARLDAANL